MKRSAALASTLLLLAGAIYLGRGAGRSGAAADSPTACLERLFRAAETGDAATYLDCFTGPQRERLMKDADSQSRAAFAAALREAIGGLKGRVVSDPGPAAPNADRGPAAPNADRALLSVERIYERHTERQSYHFTREPDGWRIDALGAIEKLQPPIPYATPVYDLQPEAE